jgi:hypothetical protein
VPANRDREGPHGLPPPPPPDRRVTSPAVRQLESTTMALRHPRNAQPVEVPTRERVRQRRTPTHTPWAVGRLLRVPGQVAAPPAGPKFPVAAAPPRRPNLAATATADPGGEGLDDGRRCCSANVGVPARDLLPHGAPHLPPRPPARAGRAPTAVPLDRRERRRAPLAPVRLARRAAKAPERSPPRPVARVSRGPVAASAPD